MVPYEIISKIGEGGFGVVYKAVERTLDRTVALDILKPGLTSDPLFMQRLQHEAKAAAALDLPTVRCHPRIRRTTGNVLPGVRHVLGKAVQTAPTTTQSRPAATT